MRPAVFTVDTFSAGQGQVTVYVEDPEGRREEVKPALNEGKKTSSVTYIPQVMGPHKVCSSAPVIHRSIQRPHTIIHNTMITKKLVLWFRKTTLSDRKVTEDFNFIEMLTFLFVKQT